MYLLTHSLSPVLVVLIQPKELKTKISHTHSLILSQCHVNVHTIVEERLDLQLHKLS